MATVTHAATATWNTTAGDKTNAFTPAVGDLIVAVAPATGVATSAVSDDQGGTYTKIDWSPRRWCIPSPRRRPRRPAAAWTVSGCPG
jgi:hypothetical protein